MNTATTSNNVEQFPSNPKPQTPREVIRANVDLLIDQLEAGQSEALTSHLAAMGEFHNYLSEPGEQIYMFAGRYS